MSQNYPPSYVNFSVYVRPILNSVRLANSGGVTRKPAEFKAPQMRYNSLQTFFFFFSMKESHYKLETGMKSRRGKEKSITVIFLFLKKEMFLKYHRQKYWNGSL